MAEPLRSQLARLRAQRGEPKTPACAYCGRRFASNHRPVEHDGQRFHKTCWREMGDESRLDHHDIKGGG